MRQRQLACTIKTNESAYDSAIWDYDIHNVEVFCLSERCNCHFSIGISGEPKKPLQRPRSGRCMGSEAMIGEIKEHDAIQ
jgi:hypothetical protein